ncbi:MAG TPA: hypothetical protein VGK73_08795 [Polyangiaceae bacterium]
MTDREPLRVGPLALKWDDDNQANVRLGRHLTLGVYRTSQGLWRYIAVFDFPDVQEVYGQTWLDVRDAVDEAERFLLVSGYLAQYRSRRRLLARECERRAEYWRSVALDCADRDANYTKAVLAHAGARAAKYARWAEALRSP